MNLSSFLQLCLISLFLCLPLCLKAQKDTTYIKSYPSKVFVSPSYVYKNFSVQLRPKEIKPKEALLYAPNATNLLGGTIVYKSLAIGGSLNIPSRQSRRDYFGKTKALSFGFQLAKDRHIISLSYRKYRGLSDLNTETYFEDSANQIENLYIRKDLICTSLDANYIFVFLPNKYSYKAAFTFKEKQLKSYGSPMLTSTFSFIKLRADSSIVHPELYDEYSNINSLDFFRTTNYGIAPGYGYTFAYDQVFLASALFVGGQLQHNRYSLNYELEEFEKTLKLTPLLNFKINLGYNGHRYFGGIAYNSYLNFIRSNSLNGRVRYRTVRIRIGMRLEPPDRVKRIEKRLLKYMKDRKKS